MSNLSAPAIIATLTAAVEALAEMAKTQIWMQKELQPPAESGSHDDDDGNEDDDASQPPTKHQIKGDQERVWAVAIDQQVIET
jgi:hypothetical protein